MFSPDWLRENLPAHLPLLAYHTLDDEILAFVRGPHQLRVIRRVSQVSAVHHLLAQLSAQWDRFRAGRDFAQRHHATLEKSVQRVLAALYAQLIAPVETALEQAAPGERLAVIPHGLLHQVPFHALLNRGQYWLDRYEISYAPSATVLALCEARPPLAPRRALVMGAADDLIPTVVAEAQAVAQWLTGAGLETHLAIGDAATPAAFTDHAPGSQVLHLACHGLFRADNPMFSSLRLHSGWLTASGVARHRLPNSLVALSACESGRGRVAAGDEVLGLPRAFLGAGAASVLVSLWLVQDETTARLMTDWYQRWLAPAARRGAANAQEMRPAAALRAAQQFLRAEQSHPYFWAPFVLMGRS
jgi:CHAT domain-containing protein